MTAAETCRLYDWKPGQHLAASDAPNVLTATLNAIGREKVLVNVVGHKDEFCWANLNHCVRYIPPPPPPPPTLAEICEARGWRDKDRLVYIQPGPGESIGTIRVDFADGLTLVGRRLAGCLLNRDGKVTFDPMPEPGAAT